MRALAAIGFLSLFGLASAQNDETYGAKIKEFTTESFFLTELVDHLPLSKTIPSPDKFFGHIIGAPNVLDYSAQFAAYLRLLEKSTGRVKVVNMGKSEEGREMVVAFVSSEANIRRLDHIKEVNAKLADPRKIASQTEADALIKDTVPMYWATGGMHAPESGPPEMLMELAYRIAASEEPLIKTIRDNEITMITPVLDADGRDRVVDLYRYRKENPGKPVPPLVYWGHYVAHDDNRDAMTMRLALSKALMKTWLDYHPTVLHDLHESVPFLYISTGTGPYNPWLDPITIDEWQEMAWHEVSELTKRGVPGVWTHGYYDGWAASYGFYVANGHNGIGRFYETFGGNGADTGIVSTGGDAARDWYRPSPPFPRVRWSIRDNTNLMESGLLLALQNVAEHRDKYLRENYLKAQRSIAKARTEGPAAWVIVDHSQRALMLSKVLIDQGVEVDLLSEPVETVDGKFPAGSAVIRMDQPYSRMADMLLDKQFYNPADPRSYDDTGWELGKLYGVEAVRCKDAKILDAKTASVIRAPGITQAVDPPTAIGLTMPIFASHEKSGPPKHSNARIALIHTWTSTQDEGWYRVALDELKVPYKYVGVQELRDTPDLKSKYDVILMPPTGGTAQSIVNGIPMLGDPIPWKPSKEYPNLGGPDQRDDIRGGIELQGLQNMQKFVQAGGMVICCGNMCRIPIDYGLVNGVSVFTPNLLNAPGGVYQVDRASDDSPVLRGYDKDLGVYFNMNSCVILSAGGVGPGGRGGGPRLGQPGASGSTRPSGRGSATDPDVIQGRPPYSPVSKPGDAPEGAGRQGSLPRLPNPQVLLRFSTADKLLISGMIEHPEELAGKAALVDCPVGKGHYILFSLNPMWRGETVGSYQLLLNAAAMAKP